MFINFLMWRKITTVKYSSSVQNFSLLCLPVVINNINNIDDKMYSYNKTNLLTYSMVQSPS